MRLIKKIHEQLIIEKLSINHVIVMMFTSSFIGVGDFIVATIVFVIGSLYCAVMEITYKGKVRD